MNLKRLILEVLENAGSKNDSNSPNYNPHGQRGRLKKYIKDTRPKDVNFYDYQSQVYYNAWLIGKDPYGNLYTITKPHNVTKYILKRETDNNGIVKCQVCKEINWTYTERLKPTPSNPNPPAPIKTENKIPLQLHHINGSNQDNRSENILLLCANCHNYTDNYGGANLKTQSIQEETYTQQDNKFSILKTLKDYTERKAEIRNALIVNRVKELLKEIDGDKCFSCGISKWKGKPMKYHVDHIWGATNHQLYNLRLLCPNCHCFTDTFGSKNKKNKDLTSRIQARNFSTDDRNRFQEIARRANVYTDDVYVFHNIPRGHKG